MKRLKIFTTILLSLFVFFSLNCIKSLKKDKHKKWSLELFPVNQSWSDPDRLNPIILSGLPENAPQNFILNPLPVIGNQGMQASGTAWSVSTASSFYFYKKRKIKGYFCSPSFLYNSLNNGADSGIELYQALELHKNTGCPGERFMKYREQDFTTGPDSRSLMEASRYKIYGFGRVDFSDINQVKGHLLQNSIIMVTMNIYDNFIDLNKLHYKQPVGKFRGRHTVSIVGYDENQQAFIIQNSAGKNWGRDGRAFIPYSWFIRLAVSAYVIW